MKRLLAACLLLVPACADGPANPGGGAIGELSMTLARSANSLVPPQADSALIRVWHTTAGTNQVKAVEIPDPGLTTTVTFQVPARTGYSVDVIAFHANEALAAGRTSGVDVQPGLNTPVDVVVQPWSFTVSAPDIVVSGEQSTFGVTVSHPQGTWFMFSAINELRLGPFGDISMSCTANCQVTFAAPVVESDSILRFSFRLRAGGGPAFPQVLVVLIPSPTSGDTLFSRPLVLAGGTITVRF